MNFLKRMQGRGATDNSAVAARLSAITSRSKLGVSVEAPDEEPRAEAIKRRFWTPGEVLERQR
jgi:hypothetical protein